MAALRGRRHVKSHRTRETTLTLATVNGHRQDLRRHWTDSPIEIRMKNPEQAQHSEITCRLQDSADVHSMPMKS